MCGIAGILAPNTSDRRKALDIMLGKLGHRGPDGQGVAYFENCMLGHTRLSIVDLDGGKQPMLYPDSREPTQCAVTFNGEIYGYRKLRNDFPTFPFSTNSDTEVLLAAYAEFNTRMAEHLPGMFAFALWDEKLHRLFCARDRFGEKPFYYAWGRNGEFVFASEIPAIVASGLVDLSIDPECVGHYLQRQYVQNGRSIYKEICSLAPSSTIEIENGALTVKKYWQLPPQNSRITLDDAVDQLRSHLSDAVADQLVADVPVGVFLSGGLDSTTIATLASRKHEGIHSYSFDFPGTLSERQYATAAANALGTQHTVLSHDAGRLDDLLWTIVETYGEPFADSSALPTYLLCGEAAKHTKVVLTGDGGDELFGGYDWYRALYLMDKYSGIGFWRALLLRIVSRSAKTLRLRRAEQLEKQNLGAIYARSYPNISTAHHSQNKLFSDRVLKDLGLPIPGAVTEYIANMGLDEALRMDVSDYMPADILTKTDRASMAHGLELRAPFLDTTFAEFSISLPIRIKVDATRDKIALRQAFEADWPTSIRSRQKQGFGAPIDKWLNDPLLVRLQEEFLWNEDSYLRDILDFSALQLMRKRLTDHQRWTLLCLSLWLYRASLRNHLPTT